MAPRKPVAYHPTSQKDSAISPHKIICYRTKRTLLQAIKDRYFSEWPGLTEKLISKYLPESYITAKGKLDQNKQWQAAEADTNVTPLSIIVGKNTSEVILQIFDPTD